MPASRAPAQCTGDYVFGWIPAPSTASATPGTGQWGCAVPDCTLKYGGAFPYWDAASGYCVAFPPLAGSWGEAATAGGAAPTAGFTVTDASVCVAGGITCVHGVCVCSSAAWCTCVCEDGWGTSQASASFTATPRGAATTSLATLQSATRAPSSTAAAVAKPMCDVPASSLGDGAYTAAQASTPCPNVVACFFVNNVWQAVLSVGVVLAFGLLVTCCAHRLCCPRFRLWGRAWQACCVWPGRRGREALRLAARAAAAAHRAAQRTARKQWHRRRTQSTNPEMSFSASSQSPSGGPGSGGGQGVSPASGAAPAQSSHRNSARAVQSAGRTHALHVYRVSTPLHVTLPHAVALPEEEATQRRLPRPARQQQQSHGHHPGSFRVNPAHLAPTTTTTASTLTRSPLARVAGLLPPRVRAHAWH